MSFEELIEKISPKLKAISKKLNGRFAFFDDEDLYQEALIHLWEKFKKGELSDKTDSYILQGCLFFLKNYIRVMYKRIDSQSVSLNAAFSNEEEALENSISAEDADKRFNFVIVDILIEDILHHLTEREKEVFLLSLEDLTTREMGKELDISHAMVVKIEKKIREKCKRLLPK